MKQTLAFLFASCLIMLMACYRNKKQPDRPTSDSVFTYDNHIHVWNSNFDHVYVDTTNGYNFEDMVPYSWNPDTMNIRTHWTMKAGSTLFRGYSGDNILLIPADTSYIEFYGKRFYPRKAKQKSLYIQKISKKLLPLDEPGNVISDSNFWGRMITTPGKAELLNTNWINRVRGIPQPSPVPDSDYCSKCLIGHRYTIGGGKEENPFEKRAIAIVIIEDKKNGYVKYCWYYDYKKPNHVSFSRSCEEFMSLRRNVSDISPSPAPIPDSTIKPTYEYVYKTTIPINQLQPTLDTINMIMENFGIDMLVSRKNALMELMTQKIGVLLRGLVVDSVKVGGKP